jgi:hypothetical protein
MEAPLRRGFFFCGAHFCVRIPCRENLRSASLLRCEPHHGAHITVVQ